MNLGCLIDSLSQRAGGLFEAVRRLSQSTVLPGDTLKVFSLEDEGTAADLPQWAPLAVQTFPPRYFPGWGYAPELKRALGEANLDVLHTHGIWKYCSKASLSWHRSTGRPHIIHPHGMLDPWAVRNSRWKKLLAALLYENSHLHRATCLRALCESEVQSIRACNLRNPICVIPNGIDLPDLSTTRPAPWKDDGRKVLLYLGRLHPKKNLGPLLRAWAVLQKDSAAARHWTLAIAGWDQGGYEEALKVECSKLEVERSVQFLGPLFGEAKSAAYQNAPAFILPSLSEGLPMVVLEAWAFARPVLMTNECNLPEGFGAGAALRIGTADEAITPGLRQLVEMSDTERAAMGGSGRSLVMEKFLWPGIGAEMRRVCEWAVGGGEPPPSVRFKS